MGSGNPQLGLLGGDGGCSRGTKVMMGSRGIKGYRDVPVEDWEVMEDSRASEGVVGPEGNPGDSWGDKGVWGCQVGMEASKEDQRGRR